MSLIFEMAPMLIASWTGFLVSAVGIIVGLIIVILLSFKAFYKKVDQGSALIINKAWSGTPKVTFTGGMVIPIFDRAEIMDCSVKTIEVDRRNKAGLICQDNVRADITVAFYVKVNKTAEDVLQVASAVGVKRASDKGTLEELFMAKFSEALKTVGKQMDFIELYNERQRFKEAIIEVIGKDLNGYILEDTAIDYLEQTENEFLDHDNILDSEGIRKITELTSVKKVAANQIQRDAEKTIKKQDVEAREAILALERQQEEAEAIQHRDVEVVRARESAEIEKVQFEENKRSQEARIQAEQELGIQRENAQREVEVAQKNRERAIAVENERVEKERQLEVINRERASELARIEKEKALEVERKNIADVVRERVAVEKTVAQEEERIKDLRATMTADRQKQVAVTAASQAAEDAKIRQVTAAEAAEKAAAHRAKEQIALAEADQAAAEKQALAEIRRSEGVQAKEAAGGLAAAKVKEADALAVEKQGLAQVHIDAEQIKLVEERGRAEAAATEAKLKGEAAGIAEKAESMKLLNESTREHEEFRLRLEQELAIAKERIGAQVAIAERNAATLAEALRNAKFDIVGGDGAFFDRFVKAVSFGKSLDAAVDRSDTLQVAGQEYLEGDRSLPADLKEVLSGNRFGTGDLKNLAATALMHKIGKDPSKAQALIDKAKELGFGDELAGWLSAGSDKG